MRNWWECAFKGTRWRGRRYSAAIAWLIYSVPVQFGFRPSDCDDIYQNVCLTLYEQLHAVNDIGKLYAWLMTTARHECIALANQNKKDSGTEDVEKAEELLDPADVEKNAIDAEQLLHTRETVASMRKRCRSLLEMLYLDPVIKAMKKLRRF